MSQAERKKKAVHKPNGRGSRPNSRNNSASRPSTPIYLDGEGEDEAWVCKLCSLSFESAEDKLLECQRCKSHFCIGCLNKPEAEYKLLTESDLMWFCTGCRERVEKDIVTDVKIEERCKKFLQSFEDRLVTLEEEMKHKCDKQEIKQIVRQQINENITKESIKTLIREQVEENKDSLEVNPDEPEETLNSVMLEINERKAREKNMVMFGFSEIISENKSTRDERDKKAVSEILNIIEDGIDEEVTHIRRVGKFNDRKKNRPILITLKTKETKGKLFSKAARLKGTKYEEIRLANDLTKSEREQEAKLFEKAKEMEKNCQDGLTYRVRGPPWARKVVRLKKN